MLIILRPCGVTENQVIVIRL